MPFLGMNLQPQDSKTVMLTTKLLQTLLNCKNSLQIKREINNKKKIHIENVYLKYKLNNIFNVTCHVCSILVFSEGVGLPTV